MVEKQTRPHPTGEDVAPHLKVVRRVGVDVLVEQALLGLGAGLGRVHGRVHLLLGLLLNGLHRATHGRQHQQGAMKV
jgi:hypothetical protein